MYAKGQGVPENGAEAVKWYRKAAELGLAIAQYNLGGIYAKGQGVPENDAEAVKWYRKAAVQGNAPAQNDLGTMYASGEGVPEDYVKAYTWFNLAAAQGNENAVENKDRLKSLMTAADISEAQKLSAELFTRIEEGAERSD